MVDKIDQDTSKQRPETIILNQNRHEWEKTKIFYKILRIRLLLFFFHFYDKRKASANSDKQIDLCVNAAVALRYTVLHFVWGFVCRSEGVNYLWIRKTKKTSSGEIANREKLLCRCACVREIAANQLGFSVGVLWQWR